MKIGLTLKEIIERRNYLGGSDISVIAGMNAYQDAFQLWEFKKGLFTPTEDNISNKFTIAGNIFENLILDLFKIRIEEELNQKIEYTGIRISKHPEYDFLQSHPDEILTNGSVIDCKTANSKSFFKKWGTENNPFMPKEYQYQLTYNAGIYYRETGILAKKIYIPVLQMTNKDYDIADILSERGQVATLENLIEFYLTDSEYAKAKQQAMNKYNKEIQKLEDDKKDRIDYNEILNEYAKRKVYLKLKKKFQIRQANFDLNTFEALEKNAIKWWNDFIIGNQIPKITEKSVSYLKTKYKYAKESKEIDLGEELDKAIGSFRAAQSRAYSLKYSLERTEEYKQLENQNKLVGYKEIILLNLIKDAEIANGLKQKIETFNATRHNINYEKLKREEPEIYNKLIEKRIINIEISERRLNIKDKFD